jgi:hypothetical protein
VLLEDRVAGRLVQGAGGALTLTYSSDYQNRHLRCRCRCPSRSPVTPTLAQLCVPTVRACCPTTRMCSTAGGASSRVRR